MHYLFTLSSWQRLSIALIFSAGFTSLNGHAADGIVAHSPPPFLTEPQTPQTQPGCYGRVCVGAAPEKKMQEMFEKPSKFEQRSRVNPTDTLSYDSSPQDTGFQLRVNL